MIETEKKDKSPGKLERLIDYFDGQTWDEEQQKKVANPNKRGQVMRGMTAGSILLGSCLTGGGAFPSLIVPVATGLALVAWWTSHTKWGQNKKRGLRARLKTTVGINQDEMEENKEAAKIQASDSAQLKGMRRRELEKALEKLKKYKSFCAKSSAEGFSYARTLAGKDAYKKALLGYEGTLYYKIGNDKDSINQTLDIEGQIDDVLDSPEFDRGEVMFYTDSSYSQEFLGDAPLDLEFQKRKDSIQSYIDIVKAYGIVPDEKFYANGGQQDELKEVYDELDQWCRHDFGDNPNSLKVAITNSIKQGFEEKALADTKNASDFNTIKTANQKLTGILKWVACEEGEKGATEIPENSGRYYKSFTGTSQDFWEKRLECGAEDYLIIDNKTNKVVPLTEPEQDFITAKVKELSPTWEKLNNWGVNFNNIPDAKREQACKLLKDLAKKTFWRKLVYEKKLENLGIPSWVILKFAKANTANPDLTPDDLKSYIPGDFIDSKTAYQTAIADCVNNRSLPNDEDKYTPAERMYIQNGGDVDYKDFWKYGANWGGTITKTAAGIGSVYFLSCLIAAAPVIGTCGAAISLPFALAYGRNVYKSWQNTLNQGANRQARDLWTLKKLNFLNKPKGK